MNRRGEVITGVIAVVAFLTWAVAIGTAEQKKADDKRTEQQEDE